VKRCLRPVEASHLREAVDDVVGFGPLEVLGIVVRARMEVRGGVTKDEAAKRLS